MTSRLADLTRIRLIFVYRALLTIMDSKDAPKGLTGLHVDFDKVVGRRVEVNPVVSLLDDAAQARDCTITDSRA